MFNCSCCYNIDALCVYQQGDWSLRSWAGFICLHFIWSIMHLLLEYIHRRFYSIPASNSHFEVRCIPCSALSVQKTMKVFLCSVLRCSACSGCPDLVDFPSTRLRHPHYQTTILKHPHNRTFTIQLHHTIVDHPTQLICNWIFICWVGGGDPCGAAVTTSCYVNIKRKKT